MRHTFGRSLVLRTSGLIFLSLLLFALGSYRLIVQPSIQGLAQAEMGMVSQQVEGRIQHLLNSVEVTLRSSQGWGMNGELDHNQVLRFNEFFFPIIDHHGEISSVNFAHESGREILLLHTPDGRWINRLSDPERWGRKTYWLIWGPDHTLLRSELRELDYDTRTRPWFRGAMALKSDQSVFWTEPYIFFTTKEPGITASMRWRGRDGSVYVVGHDVRLLDLSRFTSSLQLGQRGVAALIKENGQLLALPRDPRLRTDEELKAAVLKTAADNRLGAVAQGFEAWNDAQRTTSGVTPYPHEGSTWYSLFRPSTLGQHAVWLAVFAPETEFIPGNLLDLAMLGLIAAVALGTGSLVAVRMARRMAAPLETLTHESERIGRMELHAPVDASALQAPWQEVRQLAQAQETMRVRLRDGQAALAQANEQLEAKVNERTRAALHQTALIEALLDVIPNPIFYKGIDTRFLGCNQAYEAAFGVGREQFVGKRVLDLAYLPEDARRAFQDEDETVIRTMGRISRHEDLTFADGSVHHTLYSVTAFRDPDGCVGGLIGVIVDVTSLKEAEQAAREARAQAEAAAATKANFLANMSHEIRTPMNAVIGMTELALMTELQPRQRGYLEKAHAAATSLLRLINDILDFSKIEAGKLNCEKAEFSLEQVIVQVADLATLRARDKGLELILDIAPDVPDLLLGDAFRLGQVLTNLVSNAVKFTETGEVTLAVQCLSATSGESVLHFEVRDTGIGMNSDEVGHIFHAFSQADSSTTRRFGGTGLGLSISRRIVELLGGELTVNSQPGAGSCFAFTLRFELPAQNRPPRSALLQHEVQHMPVLVVDDNAAARDVFCHMLQALSFPVQAASGGLEALAELDRAAQRGQPYRVVLIDWKMPGLDGVDTVRRIRALFNDPRPVCLMATAHDPDSLLQALDGAAVDGILSKPATSSSLLDAIMTACSHLPASTTHRLAPMAAMPIEHIRQALAGRTVLLVEDNDTNQELAIELLRHVDVHADVASNGAQALALAARKDYALVLMDCQMPVMDGFEATRRLRHELGLTRLPVVAMTANVMAGEREKCLAAGMDDYLDKPVDTQRFYATLLRWMAPGQLPDVESLQSATHPLQGNAYSPALLVGERPLLNRHAALQRVGQDEALYQMLLTRFVERQGDVAQRLHGWLQDGQAEEARRSVHNLKGLAGNIGAEALAQASETLEQALQGLPDARAQALRNWETQLQALLHHLQASTPPADTSQPHATSGAPAPQALGALLLDLAEQLENNELQASRLASELAQQLENTPEAAAARELAREAAQYNYDAALGLLKALAGRLHHPL